MTRFVAPGASGVRAWRGGWRVVLLITGHGLKRRQRHHDKIIIIPVPFLVQMNNRLLFSYGVPFRLIHGQTDPGGEFITVESLDM